MIKVRIKRVHVIKVKCGFKQLSTSSQFTNENYVNKEFHVTGSAVNCTQLCFETVCFLTI